MTEETVEVPVSLLADLVYHFDVTSNMQVIPTKVVSALAELAPDPDDELRAMVRTLVANPEISDTRLNAIIKAVRQYDS